MVDILDDPYDSLKAFSAAISEYDTTLEKSRKDKNITVSLRPNLFYIRNLDLFERATMYYTDMLNNDCTNDFNLELSSQIRKKRLAYIGSLMKTLNGINFN